MAEPAPGWHHAKKKSFHATERERPDVIEARRRFCLRRFWWHSHQLVFVDESGVNFALARPCGRAPRGDRVHDHVPGRRWETFTIVAALRNHGVIAPMIFPGAMNGQAMRTWVRRCLLPTLRPGDIVVWDNLSVHDDPEIASLIAGVGARLEFLPPYSPDLNPIELAWAKVKHQLRTWAARSWENLVDGVADAMHAITSGSCLAWFRHCGYRL